MKHEIVHLDRLPESLVPPSSLFAFIWHFMRQVKWLLLALLVLEAGVAGFTAMVPVILGRLVNAIMTQAVGDRASDVHIEPAEKNVRIRFRVDHVTNEAGKVRAAIREGKRVHTM